MSTIATIHEQGTPPYAPVVQKFKIRRPATRDYHQLFLPTALSLQDLKAIVAGTFEITAPADKEYMTLLTAAGDGSEVEMTSSLLSELQQQASTVRVVLVLPSDADSDSSEAEPDVPSPAAPDAPGPTEADAPSSAEPTPPSDSYLRAHPFSHGPLRGFPALGFMRHRGRGRGHHPGCPPAFPHPFPPHHPHHHHHHGFPHGPPRDAVQSRVEAVVSAVDAALNRPEGERVVGEVQTLLTGLHLGEQPGQPAGEAAAEDGREEGRDQEGTRTSELSRVFAGVALALGALALHPSHPPPPPPPPPPCAHPPPPPPYAHPSPFGSPHFGCGPRPPFPFPYGQGCAYPPPPPYPQLLGFPYPPPPPPPPPPFVGFQPPPPAFGHAFGPRSAPSPRYVPHQDESDSDEDQGHFSSYRHLGHGRRHAHRGGYRHPHLHPYAPPVSPHGPAAEPGGHHGRHPMHQDRSGHRDFCCPHGSPRFEPNGPLRPPPPPRHVHWRYRHPGYRHPDPRGGHDSRPHRGGFPRAESGGDTEGCESEGEGGPRSPLPPPQPPPVTPPLSSPPLPPPPPPPASHHEAGGRGHRHWGRRGGFGRGLDHRDAGGLFHGGGWGHRHGH